MYFCSQIGFRTAITAAFALLGLRAESLPEESRKVAAVVPRFVSVVHADARTGRLVRSIVVASRPVPSRVVSNQAVDIEALSPVATAPDSAVRGMVEEAAKTFDVSPALVDSVIQVESNYNPNAVSPKGARGLMQLMPATARRFGVKNSFDAKQNIEGGVRYLKFLQQTFKDDRLAIAAYNAGEGAVAKYGNVPPYPETMNYVAKVGKKYGQARRAADKPKVVAKLEETPKPPADEPHHIVHYLDADGRMHIATR
ncbi:MAG TPA: lytic transglycosylase domain-containing protein [Bryobacteraceae bacterium]